MKKEIKKSPMKIKAEELEEFLTNILKNIDEEIEKENKSKSIRELCLDEGYEKFKNRILKRIQKIKSDVQNYLKENSLKLETKNKAVYLLDEETGKIIQLSILTLKKLNLLGVYANEKQEELSNDVVNQILQILMIRRIFHQNNNLVNEGVSFQNFVTLADVEKEKGESLEGFQVIVEKEGVIASLPYYFTRIVSLNEKDAFNCEHQMNEVLKLFKTIKNKNTTIPQEELRKAGIKIMPKEQDGKLIFYAVKSENEVIEIDIELTKKIISYMKSQIRSIAKPYKLNSEVQDTDEDAKLEYLCRCGEFLSILYQNGYKADFLQTTSEGEIEKGQLKNNYYLEDKGKIRIILPFGIDGDIEDLNTVFIKCFGNNTGLIMDKKEFASIMGMIITNSENQFERDEYLSQRVAEREFLSAIQTSSQKLADSLQSQSPVKKAKNPITAAFKDFSRAFRNSRQDALDKKEEKRLER